ncbi:MAG: threonine--tRNA ligase [Candidatus Saccharimonadales bacterium]
MADPSKISNQRHSLAHILAYAVKDLYKDVKFGVGPVIEDGFYYDFDLKETISETDLAKIEKRMNEIIKQDFPFAREDLDIKTASGRTKKAGQPYKTELINDLAKKGTTDTKAKGGSSEGVKNVSFYTIGEFEDLCRGGHVASTGQVGAFQLNKVSGAYWRGNEKNPQMQRIYGVAFNTKEELKKHLELLEEAKKRDHRKIGQEMDLFVFSDLVGSGLPMFTPKGTILRDQLSNFSNELRERYGYQKVWIPHVTKKELYEASGHWSKFGDELFLVTSQETNDEIVMKPMNCPHHTRIYAARPRSYRDLPIRYLETTTVYRDEKSGELVGLSRVRSITQDDSHVFCRDDQIEVEINNLLLAASDLYKAVEMNLKVRLSYRDESDAYLGDQKLWQSAQSQLKKAVEANKLEFVEEEGEAAFYGPKIDFMATDAIGREHQVATVQLDFVMPERFGLVYTDTAGAERRPVMIHCALLGSVERFLSVYIEHTAGRFPIWVAPEQIRIITVNQEDQTTEFASGILEQARGLKLRAEVDNNNESVGKKIRRAELDKVPYTLVIGEKEINSNSITPRVRKDLEVAPDHTEMSVENFLKTVKNEVKSRVQKTSL